MCIGQLVSKLKVEVLMPIKDYLNKQEKLEYNKILDSHYYYELLKLIKMKI
ncbi:Hypothetical protein BCD_1477 (plasmid) [Borrelia crocidurae DOU]|uniref:Uncharacterized protein n=1 Tax=Borrelia crocidurae DOU TaxID=1293575 RepID=W5SLI0_9SPIR|nr:Hypothetical protein BCD_1477 [Borrelia crocidurae DOU]